MFNENEILQLESLFQRWSRAVEFTVYPKQRDEFSRKLEAVVSEICTLSEGKCEAASGAPDTAAVAVPCFKIGSGGLSRVTYAALPTGHQFQPFLKILERIGCGDYLIPDEGASPEPSPAECVVLISDSCPRCPLVVEAAGLAACGSASLNAFFVDVMQFQSFVMEYRIKSVPATVLDRRVVLVGTVSAGRIMELVRSRGTEQFEMEEVRSLIETQKIDEAAQRLVGNAGRAVVLELLQDVEFSKRLSALVVLEHALEENADAVRLMVPSFLPMLSHSDARIRGDVADLLGKIGDPGVIPYLEPLAADPDPDVAEAAADALEELKRNTS